MSNNNDNRNFLSGKGYYIALALCALVIGLAGYAYYQTQAVPVSLPEETVIREYPALLEEDVPAIATTAQEETAAPTEGRKPATKPTEAATAPTQPKQTQALKTMSPLKGEEIFGYSMEALSYNQTTRDWRVHNGIDLSAEEGTPVFAAADGVVESAYEDDSMGYTVTISHQGGYTTTYSCLQEGLSVKAGDEVHLGQVIGCVGSTALVETTLGPHLHFAVAKQGQSIDPAEFLSLSGE